MKKILTYIASLAIPCILLSSCVTGGFDENPQLDERNKALAKAPKIESISINGTVLQRNTHTLRVVEAKPGDVLMISASIASGKDAELKSLEVTRQYYGDEDPLPLDEDSEDGKYQLTGNTHVFDYSYTVPVEDDDGAEFHDGDIILVNMLAGNTLDNFAYKSFEIVITH